MTQYLKHVFQVAIYGGIPTPIQGTKPPFYSLSSQCVYEPPIVRVCSTVSPIAFPVVVFYSNGRLLYNAVVKH